MKIKGQKVFPIIVVLLVLLLVFNYFSSYKKSTSTASIEENPVANFLFLRLSDSVMLGFCNEKDYDLNLDKSSMNRIDELRRRNRLIQKLNRIADSDFEKTIYDFDDFCFKTLKNDDNQVLLKVTSSDSKGSQLISVLTYSLNDNRIENLEEKYWYYQWSEEYSKLLEKYLS